ncbi:MICOS complex subunit MIC19 isoform X2 [Rhinatrema bivittatum]|uniref:MICOS complex subunit MIC19 isoform X2 n=1 Tax=Rhinatrema bivittatum TaxID=194408 RepID=UPI00112936A2|nr:MICOS complex subunit MIC19 isoform X2 [Rhinatrema bivittatum]
MGGSGSTRRVSFEADENDNITVVKGIRLSDNVINRMKEPSAPVQRPQPPPSHQESASQNRASSVGLAVNEEELRRRIAEELASEQAKRESETQKRLEQDKLYLREDIGRILEQEKNASNELLARALLREKTVTEEERLKTKRLAKQLEGKDCMLKKQDEYYKEQLARLEERSTQFYKVTTDEYQKAANDVETRFKRYEVHPICAELQDKIFQCYQQNSKQSLSCSALARLYLRCVNSAKQSILGRGG